jgi:hypothetical protein
MQNATHERILEKQREETHVAGLCENRSTESTLPNLYDETHMVCSLVGGANARRRV